MAALTQTEFPLRGRPLLRVAAIGGCLSGAVAGLEIGSLSAPAPPDAELTVLLRGMAAIKALFVLGGLAALLWRLGLQPLPRRAAVCYGAALVTASGAVTLIAQPAFVAAAALVFHIAEALFIATAWADGRRCSWSTKKATTRSVAAPGAAA